MASNRIGEQGVRWFVGTVEDVDDPRMLGRVRVRFHNDHADNSIATEDLPWATPINGIGSASLAEVGDSPTGIQKGTGVFGFCLDGHERQLPLIWGTYAKIPDNDDSKHDVSRLARGINSIQNTQEGPEPEPAYAAKYPYNKVTQTRSGHVIEMDDTPGHERIRIYHKSGSYEETNEDGRFVRKIVDDGFEIVVKDKTVYVKGDYKVEVKGDLTYDVSGDMKVTVKGDYSLSVEGDSSLDSRGETQITGSDVRINE